MIDRPSRAREAIVNDAITTPVFVTVHTVPAVYHGEVLSVREEEVVIHTRKGLVAVPLRDIRVITP